MMIIVHRAINKITIITVSLTYRQGAVWCLHVSVRACVRAFVSVGVRASVCTREMMFLNN